MKQLILICVLALAAVTASPAWAAPTALSVADMQDIATGDALPGASTLTRSPREVELTLHMTALGANAAYTVWWAIFNNPEYCVDGCNFDDLGIEEVDASILWATGFVTGYEGVANASAKLRRGQLSGQVLAGNGLKDPRGAEIHVIVRSHGTLLAGEVDNQISDLDGYCNPACTDTQFTIHLP